MLKKFMGLIIMVFSLSACFAPVKDTPNTNFELSDNRSNLTNACTKKTIILFVAPMTVNHPFDTNKIFYTNESNTLTSFSFNHWISPAQGMLTETMLNYLNNNCDNRYLASNTIGANMDYKLISRLVNLRLQTGEIAHASLVIHVELISLASNKILASKTFSYLAKTVVKPSDLVINLNRLVKNYDEELVLWLNQTLSQDAGINFSD